MTLQELGNTQFIGLETFRKDGAGVTTPVWVAGENNKIYAWTEANSWKIKRIRNNKNVRVCASDSRGTPQSEWLEVTAHILDTPEEEKAMQARLNNKYGFQFKMFHLMGRIRRNSHVVIEIS